MFWRQINDTIFRVNLCLFINKYNMIKYRLNMARSISTAMDYILPNAFKFTKPLIIIHG